MRELLKQLILTKDSEPVAIGDVLICYRQERPWGVPCALDFYREGTRRNTKGTTYTVSIFPEGIEQMVQDAVALIDELLRPRSGIIVATGPNGISIWWRETVEQSKWWMGEGMSNEHVDDHT